MALRVFALVIAPELAGVVLRTYGWLIILENHGFINNVLMSMGIVSEPLPLSKSMFGVVVGLTHVLLPFGVLSLLPSFQGIDRNIEKSAQILGASRLSVLRHIIIPLSLPGIMSSFFIAFTLSASAYATPALIGGAGFHVMATMVYEQLARSGRLALRRRDGQYPLGHRRRHRLRELADREPAPRETECIGRSAP